MNRNQLNDTATGSHSELYSMQIEMLFIAETLVLIVVRLLLS